MNPLLLLCILFIVLKPTPPPATHFALVELFTSQGCSSCPPADQVLQDLEEQAEKTGENLITLSFHVDYWNRLGWKDPYSHADFSDRQYGYAKVLKEQVYTPQMIVNGETVLVGSQKREAEKAVQKALTSPALTTIQLRIVDHPTNGSWTAEYTLQGKTDGVILQMALVDKNVTNKVPRGENAGKQLSHVQVVRWFHAKENPGNKGQFNFDPIVLENPGQGRLVVFCQDAKNLHIWGASMVNLK